jgi:hypothetical protein
MIGARWAIARQEKPWFSWMTNRIHWIPSAEKNPRPASQTIRFCKLAAASMGHSDCSCCFLSLWQLRGGAL